VEHSEVEEGEVVVGFAITSGSDPPSCLQPGVGAFDRPAVARLRVARLRLPSFATPDLAPRLALGERIACAAARADAGLDLALAQRLGESARVVAGSAQTCSGLIPRAARASTSGSRWRRSFSLPGASRTSSGAPRASTARW
jgi:hypothetical protein